MKIKINIQIFAIIIILLLTKQIEIYAWLMFFTLIHEIAHMITGMILKLRPKTLEIQPFGLSIVFEDFESVEKNKIIIALAGPLINIVIAGIFYFINIECNNMIIYSNILLGLVNLIPIYPLDGGRILKSIFTIKTNKEKSDRLINQISNIFIILITAISSILILIYKNIGLLIVIIYLWIIVIRENKQFRFRKIMNEIIKKE